MGVGVGSGRRKGKGNCAWLVKGIKKEKNTTCQLRAQKAISVGGWGGGGWER